MTVSSSPPKLVDVIEALLLRERDDEALDIQMEAVMIALTHDVDVETLLLMPVDEYVEKYKPAPRLTIKPPMGFDRVYYGNAAFEEGTL